MLLKLLKRKRFVLALILVYAQGGAADVPLKLGLSPDTAAEDGLRVFEAADAYDAGFTDTEVDLEMILRNRAGSESRRELSIKQLEVHDDGDKLLVLFHTPKTIRGTALLSYTHKVGQDDQWLYLPSLKRVKKIASRNKSGPFLSSEFAFEDLTSQEVEKYRYKFLRTESCGDLTCYVVERFPNDEFSGYSRQEVWVDTQGFRILKVQYYDRRGDLLKTLVASDFQRYLDHYWRAGRMEMSNHQTGKSTELVWHNYRFKNGLSAERDFTTNSLQRGR